MMPAMSDNTVEKAKRALRDGKSASTAAGEFIREEMDRFKHGDEGVHSRGQAIAIGLSKARRAGVPLRPQPETAEQKRSRQEVERAYAAGHKKRAQRAATRKRPTGRAASTPRAR
jgi:Family of unknown function (DUF6496)